MASRAALQDFDDEEESVHQGLIPALYARKKRLCSQIKNIFLAPIRPFISRTALKAYLTTILLFFLAFFLFGCAIAAYILFYWSYIPPIGLSRTIHLQFDSVYSQHEPLRNNAHPYPYGSVSLGSDIVSAQGYDVLIELSMPRTQDNQDAGNFMLEVSMYAPGDKGEGEPTSGNIMAPLKSDISPTSTSADTALVLARSRRPAILPYRSFWVDMTHKLTELPWYILGLRSEEATLRVPMFERISFAKGFQKIPSTLRLEIQSTHRLQLYFAKVHFRARFRGLRWLMYNHRIISAFIFITSFWFTEILFAGLAWAVLMLLFSKTQQIETDAKAEEVHEIAQNTIKQEEDEDAQPLLSDTERTFPTLSSQPPLRYTSPTPEIKYEPEDDAAVVVPTAITNAVDADDEDEDVDFLDSGLGTSLESSNPARRESIRRRRGRAGSSSPANVWRERDRDERP